MNEPLRPPDAKKFIKAILEQGTVEVSDHAEQELARDELTTVDAINVLRGGFVAEAEWEHGAWRYQVSTNRITVVIEFNSETELTIVTAWRTTK